MIFARERRGCPYSVERENEVEPALRVLIEVAAWVSDIRTVGAGCSVNSRGVTVELIQRNDTDDSVSRRVEDTENVVGRLENKTVSSAETLIGRLKGELISTVGEPLLIEVQAVEAEVHHRIGLGLLLAGHGCTGVFGAMVNGAVNRDCSCCIVAAIVFDA